MAIGVGEISGVVRAQDYTTIKQNEDSKVAVQQNNLVHSMQREAQNKPKQVNESDNADWQQKKFDAKDKGNGNYAGDGGNARKQNKESDGKVIVKGRTGFDIKI